MTEQDLALLDTLCTELSSKLHADGVLIIALSSTDGLMFASELNAVAEIAIVDVLRLVAHDLHARRTATEGRPN